MSTNTLAIGTGAPRTLGEKIRWARKRAGLSHDRLGALAGVSRQHLIRLEKGEHRPADELVQRLAEHTGQPVEFFLGSPADRIAAEQRERLAKAMQPVFDGLVDELVSVVREIAKGART